VGAAYFHVRYQNFPGGNEKRCKELQPAQPASGPENQTANYWVRLVSYFKVIFSLDLEDAKWT